MNYMVWTGCDSVGSTHPTGYMGPSNTGMVAAGTPRDPDHAPLGPVDPLDLEFVGDEANKYRPLYAISPVFTVVGEGSPRTIWSTSMTVGSLSTSGGPVTEDRAGFTNGIYGGLLGSEQFTYDGTSYSITTLETRKTTASNVVQTDRLRFQPSALFPMAADSKLALELDDGGTRRRFLLSEADRQPASYRWDDHGLSWTDGNFVQIKLIELPD